MAAKTDSAVSPVGTNLVQVKVNRSFRKNVSVYLGTDERGKDIRVTYPVDYRFMPTNKIKALQESNDDAAFLEAIVVKAHVQFVGEDEKPLPEADQFFALQNDSSHATAIISKYIDETVGKNVQKKS